MPSCPMSLAGTPFCHRRAMLVPQENSADWPARTVTRGMAITWSLPPLRHSTIFISTVYCFSCTAVCATFIGGGGGIRTLAGGQGYTVGGGGIHEQACGRPACGSIAAGGGGGAQPIQPGVNSAGETTCGA